MARVRTIEQPQLRLIVGGDGAPLKKIKKQASRKTQLPEDWEPSEADLAYAESRGIKGDRVRLEAEKFKNYWLGNGETKMRWEAVWRTWILNCNQWSGGRGGGPTPSQYNRTV